MKKQLFSVIILATMTSSSQINAYGVEEIRNIKDISAVLRASGAAIAALSANGASEELKLIAGISRELNKFSANAIKEQSPVVRIARLLERIAFEAPLPKADLSDSLFYKKIILIIAHCLTRDIVLQYKNKGVRLVLQNISDNRAVGELVQALTKGLAVAAVDTSFAEIKSICLTHKFTSYDLVTFFFEKFVATATKDLAYRMAGEIIRRNMDTDARSELLVDIFDPRNEDI